MFAYARPRRMRPTERKDELKCSMMLLRMILHDHTINDTRGSSLGQRSSRFGGCLLVLGELEVRLGVLDGAKYQPQPSVTPERCTYGSDVVLLALNLLRQNSSGGGDETEESGRRVEGTGAELGVSLKASKVWVVCAWRRARMIRVGGRSPSESWTHPRARRPASSRPSRPCR